MKATSLFRLQAGQSSCRNCSPNFLSWGIPVRSVNASRRPSLDRRFPFLYRDYDPGTPRRAAATNGCDEWREGDFDERRNDTCETMARPEEAEPSARPAAPRATSLAGGPLHQLRAVWVVVRRECIRFASDPLRVIVGVLQPILFLFVLGSGLGSLVNGHGEFGASII